MPNRKRKRQITNQASSKDPDTSYLPDTHHHAARLSMTTEETMSPSAPHLPSTRSCTSDLECRSDEVLDRVKDEIKLLRKDLTQSRHEFALLHSDVKSLLRMHMRSDSDEESPAPNQGTDDAAECSTRFFHNPEVDTEDVNVSFVRNENGTQQQPPKKKNKKARCKKRKSKKCTISSLENCFAGDRIPTQFVKSILVGLISIVALMISATVAQQVMEQSRERKRLRSSLVGSSNLSPHNLQGDTVLSNPPTTSPAIPSNTLSIFDVQDSNEPSSSITYTIQPTSSPITLLERCQIADKTTCGCDVVYRADYRGQISETVTGQECLRWDDEIVKVLYGDFVQQFPYAGLEDNNFCRSPANSTEGPSCFPPTTQGKTELCDIPSCDPCSCMPPCDQTSTARCGCPSVLQSQECCGEHDAGCKCNYLKNACRLSLENNSSDFCLEAELECGFKSNIQRCVMYEHMCTDFPGHSTCEMAAEVCCTTGRLPLFTSYESTTRHLCLCDFYKYASSAIDYESEHKSSNCSQAAAEYVNTISLFEKRTLENMYDYLGGKHWINNTGWLDESVPYCNWFGIVCNHRGLVIEIILNDNNLTGPSIPPEEHFEHMPSKYWTDELISLHYLSKLDLSNNNLFGSLDGHTTLFLQDLQYIDISGNLFSGQAEMLFSSAMLHANYSHNNFSSASFRRFNAAYESLEVVDLSNNVLDQDMSDVLNNVPPNLVRLDISGNSIKGDFPNPFPTLRSLQEFSIANNKINGILRDFSRFTPQAVKLDLSNQLQREDGGLEGTIPEAFFKLADLAELNLASNKLAGSIPEQVGSMLRLRTLNLSSNALDTSLPPQLGQLKDTLKILDLSNNKFVGRIPSQLGFLPSSTALHMRGNSNLSTPSPLTLCSSFDEFDIKDHEDFCPPERNALKEIYHSAKGPDWTESDKWLDEFANHCDWYNVKCNEDNHVTRLDLRSNGLLGKLSKSISDLTWLQYLDLSDNDLKGAIPTELNRLYNLTYLRLSYNSFRGKETSLGNLKKLHFIQLHGNRLSGPLPRLNISFPNQSSYVSDCGQPSVYDDNLYCEECTMCCNSQGTCYPQRPTNIEEAGIDSYLEFSWVVFSCILCTAFALALASYIYDMYSNRNDPTSASTRSESTQNRDSKYALEVIGEDSVYQFVLGKSWLAWGGVVGVIAAQIGTLFIFVKAAEIDINDSDSDLVYTYECPIDQDDCRIISDVSWRGWTVFIILMAAHLSKDIINGSKMIIMSGKPRHDGNTRIRFFVGGTLLATVSLFTIYASAVYNDAIATSNTELVANSVIILFVTEIDEYFYDILMALNSSWVESVSYTEEEATNDTNTSRLGSSLTDQNLELKTKLAHIESVVEELRNSISQIQDMNCAKQNLGLSES